MQAERNRNRRTISIPVPPPWLISNVLTLALVAALAYADREYWHWYVPDREAVSQVEVSVEDAVEDIDNLDDDLADLTDAVTVLRRDLRDTDATLSSIASQGDADFGLVDHPEFALQRLANGVALLALITNYGGFQTTNSAAGKACIGFLMLGEGSVTDCGWQHVDD